MSVLASAAPERAPMFRVSLIVEAMRAHPRLMFWVATLSQAALWTLVPALFYAAPPGDVPLVLAIGREWLTGSPYGPPLAYWLAEFAFAAAGHSIIGVYVLSQLCVIVTYWAVFSLGRRIVGGAQATMAILLMTGVSVFTVPTLDFGPAVLAMPLSALSLLFAYRAIADSKPGTWIALGVSLGLLVLATWAGLILVGLVLLFVIVTPRGRSRLGRIEPWAAAVVGMLINFSQLIWLERSGFDPGAALIALPSMIVAQARLTAWVDILLWLGFAHAGLVILLLVAGGLFVGRGVRAPAFEREPVEPFAKAFIYVFAIAPALVATVLAVLVGRSGPAGGTGPLVILSALAIVVAAGDSIRLYRQRTSALVWLGLLVVPPAAIIGATVTLPWTAAVDLEVSKPANAMAAFFTDTFHRRTGRPLKFVVGDVRTAGLVAFASPDRPSLYLDGSPERAPWIDDGAVRRSGAVAIWPVTDAAGAPPAALKARFPDMVPEVPQSFERMVQGRLSLLRVGWAVIRPN